MDNLDLHSLLNSGNLQLSIVVVIAWILKSIGSCATKAIRYYARDRALTHEKFDKLIDGNTNILNSQKSILDSISATLNLLQNNIDLFNETSQTRKKRQ